MNYIFLDFDGVLNNRAWFQHCNSIWDQRKIASPGDILAQMAKDDIPHPTKDVSPDLVANVNKLVDATGAGVVISSTWRLGKTIDQLQAIVDRAGATFKIVGKTPDLWGDRYRGHEIQQFIDAQDFPPTNIVILDDDSDMVHLMPHLCKTNIQTGFGPDHVKLAIDLFNGVPYRKYSDQEVYDATKEWASRSSWSIQRWNDQHPDDIIYG